MKWYKNHGYKVYADISGESKPKTIEGHRPDIIATKDGKEYIIEIETKQTASTDKKQHQAFRKYVEKKAGRKFRKKVI